MVGPDGSRLGCLAWQSVEIGRLDRMTIANERRDRVLVVIVAQRQTHLIEDDKDGAH